MDVKIPSEELLPPVKLIYDEFREIKEALMDWEQALIDEQDRLRSLLSQIDENIKKYLEYMNYLVLNGNADWLRLTSADEPKEEPTSEKEW